MLQDRLFNRVEERLRQLKLPLSVTFWNGKTLGTDAPPQVALRVRTPKALAALADPTMGNLARYYVEEELDVDGAVRDAVRLAEKLSSAPVIAGRGSTMRWWEAMRHSRLFDCKAIRRHYDISDNFFSLWLDPQRVYSCAYFRRADDTIDIAQQQKLDHICRKLALRPGERFLDIGCGWGALAMWAAQRYRVRATGITLSENQHAYVRRQVEARGLTGLCDIKLLDYRDVPEDEPFDKIASVGMFEHVGRENLPLYFGKMFRLLRAGGLAVNHGITLNALGQGELGSDIGRFIDEYVFPGGELCHVSEMLAGMSAQGLECRDVESLRPHYAKTLWQWVDRLEAKREAAVALVGEKAYRVWRVYMAGSAHAFARGWMSVYQVLAGKPAPDGGLELPLTRDYMYEN
jgi:cyclopropane-fatty-acyl-phospholipid synthase